MPQCATQGHCYVEARVLCLSPNSPSIEWAKSFAVFKLSFLVYKIGIRISVRMKWNKMLKFTVKTVNCCYRVDDNGNDNGYKGWSLQGSWSYKGVGKHHFYREPRKQKWYGEHMALPQSRKISRCLFYRWEYEVLKIVWFTQGRTTSALGLVLWHWMPLCGVFLMAALSFPSPECSPVVLITQRNDNHGNNSWLSAFYWPCTVLSYSDKSFHFIFMTALKREPI